MNTSIFNPTRDKYYAMILLRMNARSYTLANYGYALLKVVVGFLPFTILFGLDRGVPAVAVPADPVLYRRCESNGGRRLPARL